MIDEGTHHTGEKDANKGCTGERTEGSNADAEAEFQSVAGESGVLASDEVLRALMGRVYGEYRREADLSEAGRFVLQTLRNLADPSTSIERLHDAEREFGRGYRRDHSSEMIDLLLHFIRSSLADHKLSKPEIDGITELRVLLRIQRGILYKTRREEIRGLLESQIDWIEADSNIDYSEELYIVDLQRAFDLGYDQLLELARPHVTQMLNDLYSELSVHDIPELRDRIDQLRKVFCMIHYRRPKQ